MPDTDHKEGGRAPAGPRWRYATASALAAAFGIEAITGVLLMFAYSPSSTTAWGSVYYLTERADLGWFLRGMHRFGSYATVVLAAANLLALAVGGACRSRSAPRWWLALGLTLLAIGLGVTGNILPWDQHGYWAAVVETLIAGSTPVAGPAIQRLIMGGPDFGNLTLTRIYALHVAVLPALLYLACRAFARLGRREEPPDPGRAPIGLGAALLVWGLLAALVLIARGALLEAPANPSSDDYPARPEWYFLWLFQLLKSFRGENEIVGTLIIPGAIFGVLAVLPILDRVFPRKLAHFVAASATFAVLAGAGTLTFKAWRDDVNTPAYVQGRGRAEEARRRAFQLAGDPDHGIPPEGAAYLLARDPLHRGGELVGRKCLGCHAMAETVAEDAEVSAPNLLGYGTRRWVRGLLEKPDSAAYFGRSPGCEGMATWKETSKLTPKELDDVADFMATFAAIDPEAAPFDWAAEAKAEGHPGRKPFYRECTECHTMGDPAAREKMIQPAPDLFAWGSPRWTARMIARPDAVTHYGWLEDAQKMPAFGPQLTGDDLDALVRYLRGDYLPAPAAGPEGAGSARSGPD